MKNFALSITLIALIGIVPAVADGVENVPFTRLLAAPQQFNNKGISVTGVLHKDRNGRWCLYPTMESAQTEIDVDAFALMFDQKYENGDFAKREAEFSNKYVLVYGIVDINPPQPALYAGIIRDVGGIRTYPLIKPLPQKTQE